MILMPEGVSTVGGVAFAAGIFIPYAASDRFHSHGHPERFDRVTTVEAA